MSARTSTRNVVAAVSYPSVVVATFGVFGLLVAVGMHVTPASYLAGVVAAGLVTWHEAVLSATPAEPASCSTRAC